MTAAHQKFILTTFVSSLAILSAASAEILRVEDPSAYEAALKSVKPGDEIVLANGIWEDFEIVFEASGTEDAPITLRAETPGQVTISGASSLEIGGQHLVVSGLTFRNGYSPSNAVISFRTENTFANHVRVTNNVIDSFNKADRTDQDHWITLFGRNNVFDRNAVLGKTNKGMTMVVRLDNEESTKNGHVIEYNYFGPRDPLGGNGGETIRIGTSFTSRETSGTVVRRNYFERCSGEVEIISMKSEGNKVTDNVFFESRGSVVFRHGGRNEVSRNVFLGNGVADTGGVRVINDRQVVRDNYFEGLRGQKFNGALVVMNGVPNSPQNRYHQVEKAQITNNSFIDVAHIGLGVGTDDERSAVPVDSSISENIFVSSEDSPVGIFDDMSGIRFEKNYTLNGAFSAIGAEELPQGLLERGESGLLRPADTDGASGPGAPADLKPISRDKTGPSFFEKPSQAAVEGMTTIVGAGEAALREAITNAMPGDTLIIPARRLEISSPIVIDKTLTIKGKRNWRRRTQLLATNGLFEIHAGGDVKLANLDVIQGSTDHALVKASGETYKGAYRLVLEKVTAKVAEELEEAAPLLAADPETFASSVSVRRLEVKDWPGELINLGAEGREGWYLTDLLEVTESRFENVGGPIVIFGRDGRDESTFGPRFALTESVILNVGQGGKALDLNGIDGVVLTGNKVGGSGDIAVRRRVLGYPFVLGGNMADNTLLSVQGVAGEPLEATLTEGLQ